MASPPVVAIEIGTSKVVAVVGELRDNDRLVITGLGEHVSKGVRKGEIIDLQNAVICVRGALRAAEESGQVAIRSVHLCLSGGHVRTQVNRGSVHVTSASGEITHTEIDQVMDIARAINLRPERELLHTICQRFCVDDHEFVVNPEGLEGGKLSLDMLALHGVRSRLRNTIKAVENAPMNVRDVAFSGLCSALSVVSAEQKEIGALVIDLGGGTTDYIAYAGKTLAAAGSFGVGGDHVTNDVALAFNISIQQAELLKRKSGCAERVEPRRSENVDVPAEIGFPARSVNLGSLDTVISARVEEIFEMIKHRMEHREILGLLGSGVVLTGGGARMKGVVALAEETFELPCRVGRPIDVDGLAAATDLPEYAAVVGMVRYGFKSAEHDSPFSLGDWFKKLFGSRN